MYLTVYKSGSCYTAMRYVSKDVKARVLDDTLSTEIFTVEGTESEIDGLAKKEAEIRKIPFVFRLH